MTACSHSLLSEMAQVLQAHVQEIKPYPPENERMCPEKGSF